MRLPRRNRQDEAASTLLVVLLIGSITGIALASMLAMASFAIQNAHGAADWQAAFYHAENALHWAAQQRISDVTPSPGSNFYSTAANNIDVPYMIAARTNTGSGFRNAWVSVVSTNAGSGGTEFYLVTASARVGSKVRTLRATIIKNGASQVFDYEYFLNNWGWWWGSSIAGNGGNRANWDFDFRDRPTVNGLILANGDITQDGVPVDQYTNNPPFGGLAGTDPIALAHAGVPRVDMPNLKDLTYYQNKALTSSTNGLWVGSTKVVSGVLTNASKPGLYVVGSSSTPVRINGTVVISGDVVIKGKITGQGTLYVGGNLYVAGDLSYSNSPSWSSYPETMTASQRDAWVSSNGSKDLIAFAVRGTVFGGDVTSSDWKTWCYDPTAWGLSTVGDENHLGADGILHTGDDNTSYLMANGTYGTGYDADADGVIEGNYSYSTDITMNSTRASKIQGYPTDSGGNPVAFNQVASNNMNLLEGIFYTNHGYAMRLAKANAVFHGAVISRNEAIVYNSSCNFVYDSRIHSRYNRDPNRFVDLGLPVAGIIQVSSFSELPPDGTL